MRVFTPPSVTAASQLYSQNERRYCVRTLLSFPSIIYLTALPLSAKTPISVNIQISKSDFTRRFANSASAITLESLLDSDNALYHLVDALWDVYHSNNIRLSQSFYSLINSVTERRRRILTLATLPAAKLLRVVSTRIAQTNIRHTRAIRERFTRLTLPVPAGLRRETQTIHTLFTEQTSLAPVLQRIYEGIESNAYFYNASTYQNARTLYRLTNSLWKVYSSQNLELSRSFTRLINRITEENVVIRQERTVSNIFSTSRSLHNLVGALRQAFSGNNLQLRHNLVSLMRDIHEAGETNNSQNIHNNKTFLSLYRLFLPAGERERISLGHRFPGMEETRNRNSISKELERLIERKLDTVRPNTAAPVNLDNLYKTVSGKVIKELEHNWRLEKLQRGLI